jgi:NTP pyrophosphatase (non-canonical NTP hydrolase)
MHLCHEIAREKGFWDKERNIGELLMLIVSELGEALEAHRKNQTGMMQKDTFEDELADVFIRLFDMCAGLGIDVERQIQWKLEYNKKRPRLHGKEY